MQVQQDFFKVPIGLPRKVQKVEKTRYQLESEKTLDVAFKTIRCNLVDFSEKWPNVSLEGKPFSANLERKTGCIKFDADSSNKPPKGWSKINFNCQNNLISIDRDQLIQDLDQEKKGLSIMAVKILLVVEKLICSCFKREKSLIDDRLIIYLDVAKVRDINDVMICNLWSLVHLMYQKNSFKSEFIISLRYEESKEDTSWNREWTTENLNIGDIVTFTRQDCLFGRISGKSVESNRIGIKYFSHGVEHCIPISLSNPAGLLKRW